MEHTAALAPVYEDSALKRVESGRNYDVAQHAQAECAGLMIREPKPKTKQRPWAFFSQDSHRYVQTHAN
ncbi:hypothetical protein MRX96_054555 [Rhipicephalus microplus]